MTGLVIDIAAWSSPWRLRSPGDKLALSSGLVMCAISLPPWPAALLVAVASVALLLGPAGVRWRIAAVAARGPLTFVVLGTVGIAVTSQDAPGWFDLTVTSQSASQAAGTAARAVAGTLAILVLATTTPVPDLLAWLRRRHVPDALLDVAALVYRLLFVLQDSLLRVRSAQAARLGYASRKATLRSAGTLAASVLSRAWARSRRLEDGLTGRGFDGAMNVLTDARPSSPRFLAGTAGLLSVVVLTSLTVAAAPWDAG